MEATGAGMDRVDMAGEDTGEAAMEVVETKVAVSEEREEAETTTCIIQCMGNSSKELVPVRGVLGGWG